LGTSNAQAGDIKINATEKILLDGLKNQTLNTTGIFNSIPEGGEGNAGNITFTTTNLFVTNGATINTSLDGQGNAGNIEIYATGIVSLNGTAKSGSQSGLSSGVSGEGNAGDITVTTNSLSITDGASINSVTGWRTLNPDTGEIEKVGKGDGGDIKISASEKILLDGLGNQTESTGILSYVAYRGEGNAGDVEIATSNLSLLNGALIDSGISLKARGNAGNILVDTENLFLTNGGAINTSTDGQGDAGKVTINANKVTLSGFGSGIFSAVGETAEGNSDGIEITTSDLALTNGGQIISSTFSQGKGGQLTVNAKTLKLAGNNNNGAINTLIITYSGSTFEAGDLTLNIANSLQATNGYISTNSFQSTGGNLTIIADNIQLRGNSDISTSVLNGVGGGGNINITADSVIAFDDSDIFAFAADGQGGNIILDTPAYFAENFTLNSLTSNPDSLYKNSRPDLNATGAVSGAVTIPDVSFIQNSLNDLPNNSINTDELVANSCVSPVGNRQQGKFIITGKGGLPARPGNGSISDFSTGEVRSVPSNKPGWQRGDAIVEPQGLYHLANGKLVLSRECR
jgi:large exoprotein involved in heme utilization and adhesion